MAGSSELYLTNEPEANAFLATDPLGLLSGLVLHQQIPTEKAFHSPLVLRTRLDRGLDAISDEYDGSVAAIYEGVNKADDLMERLLAMPGFGEYKARIYLGVLAKRFGVRPKGYTKYLLTWPSIVDVASLDDLAELKARKKAWKESQA